MAIRRVTEMLPYLFVLAAAASGCAQSPSGSASGQTLTASTQVPAASIVDDSVSVDSSTIDAPDSNQTQDWISDERAEAILFSQGYLRFTEEAWDSYLTDFTEGHRLREEAIFLCMKDRGFEYFIGGEETLPWRPGFLVDSESREWVSIYGLGMSTTYFSQESLGNAAIGFEGSRPSGPRISEDSPETIYLGGLSREEYTQYSIALDGVDPYDVNLEVYGATGENFSEEAVNASCRRLAHRQHPEPIVALDEDQDIAIRLRASPEWEEYLANGWQCVQSTGISASSADSIRALLNQEFMGLGLFDLRWAELSPNARELPAEFISILARAQEFELGVADMLYSCGVHPIQEAEMFATLLGDFSLE